MTSYDFQGFKPDLIIKLIRNSKIVNRKFA